MAEVKQKKQNKQIPLPQQANAECLSSSNQGQVLSSTSISTDLIPVIPIGKKAGLKQRIDGYLNGIGFLSDIFLGYVFERF